MKEINKEYFSNISKIVNEASYNYASFNDYKDLVSIENIKNENNYSSLKSKLAEDGFVVIQMNNEDESNPDNVEIWLKNLFGDSFSDKNPGKLNYAKVQAENNAKFYINSNLAQPLHTDEGHTRLYPRHAALHCLKQAQSGGDSIVVQFKSVYAELKVKFGSQVDLLFEKNAVMVHNVYGKEEKQILIRLEDNVVGISYSPVLQKMWCSDIVFQMFDFITSYAHNPKNQIRFKLKSGQTLILDNCLVLHGRTQFPKNDGRLLYRYWFGNNAL